MGNQGLGQKKEVIKHQPTEFINQNQGTLVATLSIYLSCRII